MARQSPQLIYHAIRIEGGLISAAEGARAKAEIAQEFLDHVKNMEQAGESTSPAQAKGLG